MATVNDHLRCKKTDGRSWQCKSPAVDNSGGFCEAHNRRKWAVNDEGSEEEESRMRGRPKKGDGKERILKSVVEDSEGKRKRVMPKKFDNGDVKEGILKKVVADSEVKTRRRGRPRKSIEGDRPEGILKREVEDSEVKSRKRARPIKDGGDETLNTLVGDMKVKNRKMVSLGRGDGGDEFLNVGTGDMKAKADGNEKATRKTGRLAKGDGKQVQEVISKMSSGDLKRKSVEVYVRRGKAVDAEGPQAGNVGKGSQKKRGSLDTRMTQSPKNRGHVKVDEDKMENEAVLALEKGDEYAVVLPVSPPLSPHIGESAHQQSLVTRNERTAPSASTSSMALKKHNDGQTKIADIRLESPDIGSEAKAQNAVSVPRAADNFSVSKCAAVLNEMTSFTPEELVKASRLFVKPFNREMFLSLKDELRREWLRSNLSY